MPRLPSVLRLPSKLRRRARRSRLFTMILLIGMALTILTPLYIIYKPPHLLIRYFAHRWPSVLWHVELPAGAKMVGLTIDDAPSEHTHEIAALLKANGARATFFVIGAQLQGREDVLLDLVRDGHELGNHAMHDEPSRALDDDVLRQQIGFVKERIHEAYADVGVEAPPDYFRPGSGFFSERMLRLMEKVGYKLVLGGIYPHDPQIPYWRVNARHILSMLRPGGIIVCHDRRGWTVPMLESVLPEMKRRGYRVVTVTELLNAAKT